MGGGGGLLNIQLNDNQTDIFLPRIWRKIHLQRIRQWLRWQWTNDWTKYLEDDGGQRTISIIPYNMIRRKTKSAKTRITRTCTSRTEELRQCLNEVCPKIFILLVTPFIIVLHNNSPWTTTFLACFFTPPFQYGSSESQFVNNSFCCFVTETERLSIWLMWWWYQSDVAIANWI